jgi:hypothetical protein
VPIGISTGRYYISLLEGVSILVLPGILLYFAHLLELTPQSLAVPLERTVGWAFFENAEFTAAIVAGGILGSLLVHFYREQPRVGASS